MPRDLFQEIGKQPKDLFEHRTKTNIGKWQQPKEINISPETIQYFKDNPTLTGEGYDMDGYIKKYGIPDQSKGQHLTDEFKLPNHITFSTDSIYSNNKTPGGKWEQTSNGKWQYTPSDFVLSQRSAEALKNYFKNKEPDSILNIKEPTLPPKDLFEMAGISTLPEEPTESLLKSTAKGFAKGGATFMPKAFWGGVKVLKDVANQYPAFTPWAAGTQLIPEGYPEKQIAEVEKTAEYLTPEERKGWTKYIPKAAETLGQMAGSAVSTAGVGTLPAMAVGAGIDRTLRTQKEGESLPKSLLAGGMSTIAEYGTEVKPMQALTKIGVPFLKRLASGIFWDVPGEIIETFMEMKSIDEGLLGKKYTPQEYAKAILDTAATAAMTTGIATTAVQPFREMPPKRPFIPEAEEVALPPGEKPLIQTPPVVKPPEGFVIDKPIQPLPKPENVEMAKPPQKEDVLNIVKNFNNKAKEYGDNIGKFYNEVIVPIAEGRGTRGEQELAVNIMEEVEVNDKPIKETLNEYLNIRNYLKTKQEQKILEDVTYISPQEMYAQIKFYEKELKTISEKYKQPQLIQQYYAIRKISNAQEYLETLKNAITNFRDKGGYFIQPVQQPKGFTPIEAAPVVSKEIFKKGESFTIKDNSGNPLTIKIESEPRYTKGFIEPDYKISIDGKLQKSPMPQGILEKYKSVHIMPSGEVMPGAEHTAGIASPEGKPIPPEVLKDYPELQTEHPIEKFATPPKVPIKKLEAGGLKPIENSLVPGTKEWNMSVEEKIQKEKQGRLERIQNKGNEELFLHWDLTNYVKAKYGGKWGDKNTTENVNALISEMERQGIIREIVPTSDAPEYQQLYQKYGKPEGVAYAMDRSKKFFVPKALEEGNTSARETEIIQSQSPPSSQTEIVKLGEPKKKNPNRDQKDAISSAIRVYQQTENRGGELALELEELVNEGKLTLEQARKVYDRTIQLGESGKLGTTGIERQYYEDFYGQTIIPKGEIVKEPTTNLETFGFQSMYEAGEKLVKNTSEYVKAQQEYKKILKEGGVTEDIPHDIGKFKQFISFPHTIAKRFPKTKVFQERTYQQVEQFENLIGDLKNSLDPYIKKHDKKVDQALIEGYVSPAPKLFSDQELKARGLSQEETQAYRAVSPTMKAAAKVLEQHLLKVGKDPQEVQAWMADFQESYIPLSRFGKFYVSVKDAQGNGITTPTFDNVGQARKGVVDLRRQYPNSKITMGNVKRLAPEAYEGMPLNVLAFLSKFDENLSANFASVIGKGFPGHLLQVKKTPGFETNLKKSISDYILSLARYVSINEYQRDITNMLDYEKSGIVDPKGEAGLWGYWKRHSDYIVSNPKEFAKFRQFFYYYYLGANIKSALLNATQPLTTTYPVLSKYAKQPAMLMAKAFKLAAHTQKGLEKINPELAYAVQSAIHDGTISEQNINELRGLQQGKSASKIGNALSFLFSSAEKYNRKVSFIAMYMAAKEGYLRNGQQRSHAEMQKMAEDFVKETQYDYRKVDRPELARGWRAPLFTFRMFSGNYLSMLKNFMVEKEFAALARSLGVMLILGGVSAIPGWKELEKALELMDYDPKKSFREYMGKEQGELALHGLPFKTGGNISGALGTVELLPGDIQQGVTAGIANLVLGVPTDIPKRFDRARQYLFKLNSPYRAVEAVMPEFVRNPMVAIRWIREEGIRSPKFEKLGTATNKDIFFKAIGIQPSNLTNIYERKHSAIVIKNRVTKNTEEYNFRLARALYGNDIEEYKKTLDEIIRHNQKSKSELDFIIPDKSSIKRQVQGMYDSGIKDIKEMPKRGRRALMELEEVY